MKLPVSCWQCDIDGVPLFKTQRMIEFNEDFRYEIDCQNGHKSIILLQQQKFEILFDIGAHAIIDGYYREAVSSFTSALERFYEFFIRVVCVSKKLDLQALKEAWAYVAVQSERQLGAFIFLYLQEFGNKPTLLKNDTTKFRNDVIHKGKIPNRKQAIDFGQEILNIVRPTLKALKENYSDAVSEVVHQHLTNISKPTDTTLPISTMCTATILSLTFNHPGHDEMSMENAIINLAQLRYT
ncbi:hypothetical protein Q4247_10160 [Acinetobacter baumannii]